MNQATLDRLKLNPHYKPSAKQRAEIADQHREPMVEFGGPDFHDNTRPTHPNTPKRVKRTSKKVIE